MPITPEAIIDIVIAETCLPREKLLPDATLGQLDISSLDLVSIVFEMEDKFDITLSTDDLSPDLTIAQLIDQLGAQAAA